MNKSFTKYIRYLFVIVIVFIIFVPKKKLTLIPTHFYEIILFLLFFMYFIMNLYIDIKHRQYSTSIYIIAVDVANIFLLIVLCYLYFENYDKTNVDILWNRKIRIQRLALFIILMVPIKVILENQKFKK